MGTFIENGLSEGQKNKLTSDFLKKLGSKLKEKRKKRNISQEEIADCLGIDQSTISKYESGERDMQISMLPLYSVYCKFPIHELFDKDESQEMIDALQEAVIYSKQRREKAIKRTQEREYDSKDKVLVARIYEKDGETITEPIPIALPKLDMDIKERYKYALEEAPVMAYSQEEVCEFIKTYKGDLVAPIVEAGKLLAELKDVKYNKKLKDSLADFIIDEMIIEVMKKGTNERAERIYAYYRKLWDHVEEGTILHENKLNSTKWREEQHRREGAYDFWD